MPPGESTLLASDNFIMPNGIEPGVDGVGEDSKQMSRSGGSDIGINQNVNSSEKFLFSSI